MPDWTPRDTDRARELRNNATPAERLLWRHLKCRRTGAKFSRQMQIGRIFPDFLCRELGLIVECDGISHDREPEKDARRGAWLGRQGYTVLRFTNADVLGNVDGVVKAIELEVARLREVRTGASRTGPPPTPPASGMGAEGLCSRASRGEKEAPPAATRR